MAFYEYWCEDCKKTFTVSELISEHEEHEKGLECPKCGGVRTKQLLSGFFAKTDSKT
jgi:putative FmdB family regulatory protein